MEKIGDVIKRVISKKGQIDEIRRIDDIDSVWYKIVDESMRLHSYVVRVKGNSITIRVDNRCYLTEIKRKEKEFISQLQNYGWKDIKRIDCRIG
ncbi:MAG TPA: DciA family protein [bacterium]|nr:DciA family protein [bacterium]HPP29815.1 DciA family protein [bacterium]